jgi:hypothetical protein
MTTRVWSKKETQNCIRQLRAQGVPVRKKGEGHYLVSLKDGTKLWEALRGSQGYLVRYVDDFFVSEV